MTMRGEAVPQGRRGDLDGARAVAIAVALAATLTAGFAAGRLSVPDVGSAAVDRSGASSSTNQMRVSPSGSPRLKASLLPSGDHVGSWSISPPSINGCGGSESPNLCV